MGNNGGYHNEKPAHEVFVDDFRISRFPVTNEQYAVFVAATGRAAPWHWGADKPRSEQLNYPVTHVSWNDAKDFCSWLCIHTKQEVRLATEAEWEKAAKGDSGQRRYPWGNEEPDANRANFRDAMGETTPAGIYLAGKSPYGCLGMAGNVHQWTHSLREDYPYDQCDGREDETSQDVRVVRGGAFDRTEGYLRCTNRVGRQPDNRSNDVSFRLVVSGL